MADMGEKAAKQLSEITECSICMNTFTDPKVLPCIHTFCFQCLKDNTDTEQKKPGDKMPCPLCRKEFTIPPEGITGLQRNFFMENLLEFKTTLQIGSAFINCDVCVDRNEGTTTNVSTATKRCLECKQNYCDSCSKIHQKQTVSSSHHLANIGRETEEQMRQTTKVKSCIKHINKPLDYCCVDCKKIVCVSCFFESHKSHDCKDVATVDEELRQTIVQKARKVSNYADELLSMRKDTETRKTVFLKKMVERKNAIYKRNQELKDMIDEDTKSLFVQLSVVESNQLKEIENDIIEIEKCCSSFRRFVVYCTELRLKGSTSDICGSVDELLARADDLKKDHDAFTGRPSKSVEVSFQGTDLREVLQRSNSNVVGQIKVKSEDTAQFENCAIVVGINDVSTITEEVLKINLHRPNEISTQTQIPTKMTFEAVAAVHCNTMYVAGVGANNYEIWKYKESYGWKKCASLVQGRRRHSAAFIGERLYICGGFVDSDRSVLNSVEAYDTVADKCSRVGKLLDCVHNSGNCVSFKSSLYIFGGVNKDNNALSRVQVYNTKYNKCSRISKPMPRHYNLMRAVLWETSVVLLGWDTCFIFNFETETWQERKQFKTDVVHFGLALENERVFIIGGGICEQDKDGRAIWKCRDDVRYIPLQNIIDDKPIEWKIHARLTKPGLVQTYSKLTILGPSAKRRSFLR